MREIWKGIKGFEGYYLISNLGNIMSTGAKRKTSGTGNYDRESKILKQHPNNKGYMTVHLYKNGEDHQKLVHRLVAETFIENPCNFEKVNHKDENPSNNAADNLEWCTQKYNMNYGSVKEKISKGNSKPVLQLTRGGEIIKRHNSIIQAQRDLGISNGSIGDCLHGRRKTAGGFLWEYAN